ncbi:MAG: DUF4097 domain-containing protein [Gammaproteobacteria bacterium]
MKTNSYTKSVRNNLALVLMAAAALTMLTSNNMVSADVSRDSKTRVESFSYDVNGRSVTLGNIAGEITLSPSSSDKIEITATVVAGGRDAQDNLDLIKFEDVVERGVLKLRTVYPTDEYDKYIYQRKGGGNSSSSFRYQGEKVKVGSGRRFRDGLELHVDFDIQLPADVTFNLVNGAGQITAVGIDGDIKLKNRSGQVSSNNTSGDITLDTGSGAITGIQHRGDLSADSGSGRVKIRDVSGNVLADTGSGSISVENVGGEVNADTGSGRVDVRDAGGEVRVDTGSGRVTIDGATGSLNVDTGSGSIDIDNWMGGSDLDLDTGSGSISARGDFSAVERLKADTGSGSISLISNTVPNMKIDVSSRNIEVDFPDMSNIKQSRSSFRGTIGSGTGRGDLSSGSGRITFRQGDT